MKLLIIFLLFSCQLIAQEHDPKPVVDSVYNNIDIINKHLQENYKLDLGRKIDIVLTGEMVQDFNQQLKNRTYTSFKIEF
jgi:hypothetical protein